jgi:mRNA interferase MazF
MEKEFDHWNGVKKALDKREQLPSFQERQIWWCSIGVNVGFEVYGKGKIYTRPVLVVRKFSKHSFFGVPMTSKRKTQPYHFPTFFKGTEGSAQLAQLKLFDSKRLMDLMGYLPDDQYNGILAALTALFHNKKPS